MKYVVFGAPLHVEAISEAEAVRIGEQHGLPSPIAVPLPEPIQMDQSTHEYKVYDRAKVLANYFITVRAESEAEAERIAKEENGFELPHADRTWKFPEFKKKA